MDIYRLLVSVVSLACGILILVRLAPVGISPIGLVTGLAFLGFGVYRLRLAASRYRANRMQSR